MNWSKEEGDWQDITRRYFDFVKHGVYPVLRSSSAIVEVANYLWKSHRIRAFVHHVVTHCSAQTDTDYFSSRLDEMQNLTLKFTCQGWL